MAQWLRQSTAVNVMIGPALGTGGLAIVTTLKASTVTALKIRKHTATVVVSATGANMFHVSDGHYYVPMTTTHTNTLGHLRLYVRATGTVKALPMWQDFHVVPANVFDSLVSGTARLNTITVSGVWNATTRTLTSGLVMWSVAARTLTSAGNVWTAGARTLTSGANVWAAAITEVTGVPAASPVASKALGFVYVATRNKRITTATGDKVHNSASSVIAKATLTASTTIFTKAKYVTATA